MTENELTDEIREAIIDVYKELWTALLDAVVEMKPVFSKHLLTYLRLFDKRVGLFENFSSNNIRDGITRIVN